jgi:copper transport protein
VQVSVADRAASVGPLNARLLHAGPGHYLTDALAIPGAGTWTLTVTVRLDQFTAATASTTFPVR